MRLTLVQTDIVWGDRDANLANIENILRNIGGKTDLVVLPEMFTTGFITEPQGVAEKEETMVTVEWMRKTARETRTAVAGSVAIETKTDGFRNRFYFVKPAGEIAFYDKHHLFTYGGEHLMFSAGTDRVIVEWQGWRVLLQVCYDLRFPVFSRNHGDYDVALYVASWPRSRRDAWNVLLQARAIENQCYVAGLNRVGNDPACSYSGDSVIIDPKGQIISKCTGERQQIIEGEIDMEELLTFRRKFPVLADGDTFVATRDANEENRGK